MQHADQPVHVFLRKIVAQRPLGLGADPLEVGDAVVQVKRLAQLDARRVKIDRAMRRRRPIEIARAGAEEIVGGRVEPAFGERRHQCRPVLAALVRQTDQGIAQRLIAQRLQLEERDLVAELATESGKVQQGLQDRALALTRGVRRARQRRLGLSDRKSVV